MSKPWGWITCIDASGCDPFLINSPANFQKFVDELLEKIDMVRIGDLNVFWCQTNDPNKVGYSIYQLLQDSNISAHFCPEDNNSAYLDVFSCKEYDEKTVEEVFKKYFEPKKLKLTTIPRQAP